MIEINKVAVIGAGTMGSGIASHLANAGTPVVLLDIAADKGSNRNAIAQGAVERLLASSPPAFMDNANAGLITIGNIEDNMDLVADADWIVEAVVERLDIKRRLYKIIDQVRKPGAMVSSNTSTIPLKTLGHAMPESFQRDFCITHFFNPVRYMRLLEIVAGPHTRPEVIETLSAFSEARLGKGVVACRDTPGFLGNRVGVYALQVGITAAAHLGLTVEQADAIMGRPMGIPKTGVFGLYDLIGLDLMVDAAASLSAVLPADDAFQNVADGIPLVCELIAKGYSGNKGKGGFYRMKKSAGDVVREAVNLQTGEYARADRFSLAAATAGEADGLRALVEVDHKFGQFAWRVLAKTLSYAASLIPRVTDDPLAVDEAMKLGYSWSKGPFEMIDELGPAWFKSRLESAGMRVPEVLANIGDDTFYRTGHGQYQRRIFTNTYRIVERASSVARLTDKTKTRNPLIANKAASLWDVDDGVACLEFHSKANALSPDSMALMAQSLEVVDRDFTALLIHNDAAHFSVGFSLDFALAAAKEKAWSRLDAALAAFQATCKAARYAPFPVVGAPAGMSVGGGFEVLVQCDALVAHANINVGLVETLVGLVPSGGGCKEMLRRWTEAETDDNARLHGTLKVFETIGMAKTASSPILARPLRMFLECDRYCMNRDRLLAVGKARALELANDYTPPVETAFTALGPGAKQAMQEILDRLDAQGITTPHDLVVADKLAWILGGGDRASGEPMSEDDLLKLEREAFIALCDTPATVARIEYMLAQGRPLRN